jgi:uncharacterized membrane protein
MRTIKFVFITLFILALLAFGVYFAIKLANDLPLWGEDIMTYEDFESPLRMRVVISHVVLVEASIIVALVFGYLFSMPRRNLNN